MPVFKRSKKDKNKPAPRTAQELMQEEGAALPQENLAEIIKNNEHIVPSPKDIMLSAGSSEDSDDMSSSPQVAMPETGEALEVDLGDSVDNSFPNLESGVPMPPASEGQQEEYLQEPVLETSIKEALDHSIEELQEEEEMLEVEAEVIASGIEQNEEEMPEAPLASEITEEEGAASLRDLEDLEDLEEREEVGDMEASQLIAELEEKARALSDLEREKSDLSLSLTNLRKEKEELTEELERQTEQGEDLRKRLAALEESAREKEDITSAQIASLEEQIEELAQAEDSEEKEREKEIALRQRIEGLLLEITPEGAKDPDFSKLNTLLQSVEEYHDFARAEKERIETLHSLAEMELQRAREQTIEADKSKSSLEKERVEIASLRSDLEREQEVLRAEKENLQVDRVEVTRTLAGARERERRTEQELLDAQEARDKAEAGRRDADLLKRKLEIGESELESRKQKITERERRLESRERAVQEQNDIAEEQRKYSLEILENVTEMRRSLERSRAEVESQQEHLRQERAYYEEERLKTEKQKDEYEKGIEELTSSREGVVDELERARQTREEAEREREVLSEELRAKIYAAGEEAREAREELSRLRDTLESAERELSESERERHELRAEVQRLTGMAEDGSLGKEEARELRQWVARSRELEAQLQELRSRAPVAEDIVALAQEAIQELGDSVLGIKGGDPAKRSELQKLLTDLMDVATGNDHLVHKTVERAKELIKALEAEGALDSSGMGSATDLFTEEPKVKEQEGDGAGSVLPSGINADPVQESAPTTASQSSQEDQKSGPLEAQEGLSSEDLGPVDLDSTTEPQS